MSYLEVKKTVIINWFPKKFKGRRFSIHIFNVLLLRYPSTASVEKKLRKKLSLSIFLIATTEKCFHLEIAFPHTYEYMHHKQTPCPIDAFPVIMCARHRSDFNEWTDAMPNCQLWLLCDFLAGWNRLKGQLEQLVIMWIRRDRGT